MARTTWTSSSRSTSSSAVSTRTAGRCKRSSSRSVSTTTESAAHLDALILEAIRGQKSVGLETILERVDWSERVLLTFDELAGGLRRVGDAGSIREISPGRYADANRTSLGGPVGDLALDDYDAAVRRYHEHFARGVGHVTSSFPIRVFTLLFETVFRVTGGRFGLEPGIVDLDGVWLSFSLDEALDPLGWACESAHRLEGVRIIDVRPVDGAGAADREVVVTTIQQVVSGSRRFAGRHRVVFPGGVQVDLA